MNFDCVTTGAHHYFHSLSTEILKLAYPDKQNSRRWYFLTELAKLTSHPQIYAVFLSFIIINMKMCNEI